MVAAAQRGTKRGDGGGHCIGGQWGEVVREAHSGGCGGGAVRHYVGATSWGRKEEEGEWGILGRHENMSPAGGSVYMPDVE
jgi:hypothetical protein